MGWFKTKSKKQKLQEKYQKLTEEAFRLSHTDRRKSDLKTAEANAILSELEALD